MLNHYILTNRSQADTAILAVPKMTLRIPDMHLRNLWMEMCSFKSSLKL